MKKLLFVLAAVILTALAIFSVAMAEQADPPFDVIYEEDNELGPDMIYRVGDNVCVEQDGALYCGCPCFGEEIGEGVFTMLYSQDEGLGPEEIYTLNLFGWTCVRDGNSLSCACANCNCGAGGIGGVMLTATPAPGDPLFPYGTQDPNNPTEPPTNPTAEPTDPPVDPTVEPTDEPGGPPFGPNGHCNQGIGNGSEGCDPGNSNNQNPSNDEPGGGRGKGKDKKK